jgi:hypothetical protein
MPNATSKSPAQRQAALGILVTWCAYLLFVWATDWSDFGLTARPENAARWSVTRISTMTAWLLLAFGLLRIRRSPVNWKSFGYAAAACAFSALLVATALGPQGSSYLVLAGSVTFFALASGHLCVTVQKTSIAIIMGLATFIAQFLLDAGLHVFSGVFRFH